MSFLMMKESEWQRSDQHRLRVSVRGILLGLPVTVERDGERWVLFADRRITLDDVGRFGLAASELPEELLVPERTVRYLKGEDRPTRVLAENQSPEFVKAFTRMPSRFKPVGDG